MGSSIWARNVGGRLAFLGFPWRSDVVNFGAFCPAEGYSVRNTLHGGRGITWGSERRRGYSAPNPFFFPQFRRPHLSFHRPDNLYGALRNRRDVRYWSDVGVWGRETRRDGGETEKKRWTSGRNARELATVGVFLKRLRSPHRTPDR